MEKLTMAETDFTHLARAMRKVAFFAPLRMEQLEAILKYIMLCRYKVGETVFKQGSPGDAFYIVYDGAVAVKIRRLVFLEKQVARLGPGDFFGEMALLDKDPRSATVVCEQPTRLFVLLSADFAFVLRENPAFADEMRRLAEQRKFMSRREPG